MQTLADFLHWAEDYFNAHDLTFGHGTDNEWDEAVAIARFVLNLSPTVGKEVLTRKLNTDEKNRMLFLVKRRVSELIPVPYLTNEAWFADEKYYVDERVIIPRSPFAELIKDKFEPWLAGKNICRVLDLCTGSGCIAIACAKNFPEVLVDGVDISEMALAVAKYNIQQHKVANRVFVLQSDLFTSMHAQQYDIIVSNPPYVSDKEHYYLPAEYLHEPKLALTSGIDGFNCTREILKYAAKFLTEDGLLFVEVGSNWRELVTKYPSIPFTWLEFTNGGDGVFMLTRAQLVAISTNFI